MTQITQRPCSLEIVLTPANYVLTVQNKFGVGTLQPVFIDNQVFFVDASGNNVITMIWEFTQSSYVTNSASVKSSNLISSPVDMTAFQEPNFIDGFFVLFVNNDGTLAVLQTLKEENIAAFTLSDTFSYPATDQTSGTTATAAYYKKSARLTESLLVLSSAQHSYESDTGCHYSLYQQYLNGCGTWSGYRVFYPGDLCYHGFAAYYQPTN